MAIIHRLIRVAVVPWIIVVIRDLSETMQTTNVSVILIQ